MCAAAARRRRVREWKLVRGRAGCAERARVRDEMREWHGRGRGGRLDRLHLGLRQSEQLIHRVGRMSSK